MKGIDMDKKQASKMQIKDIADKLGLSVSTVSVVLNGRGDQVRISKETQKKVLNAAKEINYHVSGVSWKASFRLLI